jgi:uncharacterized cupin superfamily protein
MKVYKPTPDEIKATHGWNSWSKEPSVFPWYYDEKETCYILEGEAKVKDDKGNEIYFTVGDMVEFPVGLACEWNIIRAIRKKYKFG